LNHETQKQEIVAENMNSIMAIGLVLDMTMRIAMIIIGVLL